jgi:pimeloyl-ACP methyl ester carboxylesterase
MSNVRANGILIEYETFGAASDRPLLLIIGLGGQMIHWDEDLCKDLARRGHYVIRYDNRDVGRSTKFEAIGVLNIPEAIGKILNGEEVQPPYTLEDMADDAVGLLDALGVQKAHICGMSMGGMIAQAIAICHPSRVLSLISIYSTTGNRELPQPKPEILRVLTALPPNQKEAYVEHMLRLFKTIAGPRFGVDEGWTGRIMADSFDRSYCPQGEARQLFAILTQKDRRAALGSLKVPTLVVHGTDDPLVPVEGGRDTAKSIPGAQLMLIEGMGHDLPHGGAWPQIIEAIADFTKGVQVLSWIEANPILKFI